MNVKVHLIKSAFGRTVMLRLNADWHRAALLMLVAITLAHWVEHIAQAVQIFILGWPRAAAQGAVGLAFPVLVTSEWLHYAFAFVTLLALVVLRPAFHGRSASWWNAAIVIQLWHHFEHALLLGQALSGVTLFGSPVPTSLIQLVFPRVELHLAYNLLVLIPMVVAMRLHDKDRLAKCACVSRAAAGSRARKGAAAVTL